VVVGRPFSVVLADRPGSGHAWSCRPLPDGIRLLDTRYVADVPREVGSPRDKEVRLVAERPGRFTLVFELRRPWEAAAVEERTVQVRARPSQEATNGGR
jgi:predicted secreted protein